MSVRPGLYAAALCLFVQGMPCAQAQDANTNPLDDLFTRTTLLGDWYGLRTRMEDDMGIVLTADEILEPIAVVSGGSGRGAAIEGRFEIFANIDLGPAIGWQGASLHANAYQIHGGGLPATTLSNLLTVSNIEAVPSTRLFTLWVQQSFFQDSVSVRLGQIAADDEFFVSQYAALFINSAFGWPSILGVNLPSGGPAYPLATPGVRVRTALTPQLVLSAALFNGDPAPAGPGDPQMRDAGGTDFRFDGGLFMIGEAAYSDVFTKNALPGSFKLGLWYHDSRFDDQHKDASGLSLANPATTGIARTRDGDYGLYVVADQLLWRKSGTSDEGLGAFLRAGMAPAERNLIAFHADAGVTYPGLIPGRDNDMAGLAISYEDVSSAQRALAADQRFYTGLALPRPDYESVIELSYQSQIAPWWIAQPDLQLILHPGARIPDLTAPQTHPEANALVFGFRSAISL